MNCCDVWLEVSAALPSAKSKVQLFYLSPDLISHGSVECFFTVYFVNGCLF